MTNPSEIPDGSDVDRSAPFDSGQFVCYLKNGDVILDGVFTLAALHYLVDQLKDRQP